MTLQMFTTARLSLPDAEGNYILTSVAPFPSDSFPVVVGVVSSTVPPGVPDLVEELERSMGAEPSPAQHVVTAMVEILSQSHEPAECDNPDDLVPGTIKVGEPARRGCHPEATPDCWHTSVRLVEKLRVPRPVEVPTNIKVQSITEARVSSTAVWWKST